MRNGFHGLSRAALVATLLTGSGAWAEAATSASPDTGTAGPSLINTTFATQAMQNNLAALKRSQLAAERSENPQLRLFAEQMITGHSKTGAELQRLADRQGVTLPTASTPRQNEELAALAQQRGPQFDAVYVKQLQRDQDAAAQLFERAARDEGLDADLRDFARRTLAGIRQQQPHVRELNGAIAGLQPMPAVIPSRRVHHVW